VVFAFTDCGDPNRGFARVYCDACRNEYLLAFSCTRRGFCPSCAAKRGAIFGAFLREEVLDDVPHWHVDADDSEAAAPLLPPPS
jgi:hypothetical protein